ncbi:MAG TPA: FAD binding domain-containing protein [Actinomycetota bacterium]|nr:FAD binding domain-containing protein [Actinomycetota bacterium]
MRFLQPQTLEDALELKAQEPEAVPLAGGTDLMVELNFDRRRPEAIMDLTRVAELRRWRRDDGELVIGPGMTYTRLLAELDGELPGLAIASRTVGSPQIRNRGTVGGNLGTASAAGDALPPLVAAGARIEVASQHGSRTLSIEDFLVGAKKNALEPDELITAIRVRRARGPQQFSKIGTRNAMVIAVCSFALDLDAGARKVGTGIGSAGPVTVRAAAAESFLQDALAEEGLWESRADVPESASDRFAELVAEAASPIDDVRGTAAYRRRALTVMGRRTLAWAWAEYRGRE